MGKLTIDGKDTINITDGKKVVSWTIDNKLCSFNPGILYTFNFYNLESQNNCNVNITTPTKNGDLNYYGAAPGRTENVNEQILALGISVAFRQNVTTYGPNALFWINTIQINGATPKKVEAANYGPGKSGTNKIFKVYM